MRVSLLPLSKHELHSSAFRYITYDADYFSFDVKLALDIMLKKCIISRFYTFHIYKGRDTKKLLSQNFKRTFKDHDPRKLKV
jgi:hypothetical protein